MKGELPPILVPLVELGECDLATVVVTSVELWPDRVLVRAVALPWKDGTRTAPTDPSGPEHRRLPALHLSDDMRTPYRLSSGGIGGTDTKEAVTWIFRPGIPVDARHLTLQMDEPGCEPVLLSR
ncbi:hypothetical protein ACIPWL_24245 [Streptomyces sp. NPDC090023]|uniref:hypothetical protein n=1 Tax=unclassified Streptomyces TaxID=2593676 RepID=UPI00380E97B1